jgi:hypothetical protein
VLRISGTHCPYCRSSSRIYASAPKSIWEELAVFVLLRPVRCHDCMRRFLRPLFVSSLVSARLVDRKTVQREESEESESNERRTA